jgi:hypothetical protein
VAQVYSTAFLEAQGETGSLVYTVPPAMIIVVRQISVFWGNQAVAPGGRVLGGAGQAFWSWAGAVFAPNNAQWVGRHVITAGHTLTVTVDNGNSDISVSGYLLTAP